MMRTAAATRLQSRAPIDNMAKKKGKEVCIPVDVPGLCSVCGGEFKQLHMDLEKPVFRCAGCCPCNNRTWNEAAWCWQTTIQGNCAGCGQHIEELHLDRVEPVFRCAQCCPCNNFTKRQELRRLRKKKWKPKRGSQRGDS